MDEQTSCSKCGKPADRDFQMGLCADCLLAGGFGSVADATAAGSRARFVPPEVSEIAPLFPQLEVLEPLGCGGMGAVYKARQKNLDRFVALKILPAGIGSDPAFAARFSREAKALAKLNHPNIVTIHDFGQAGELFYFLMEYVDGVNLGQLLRPGRISSREALAIVPQICDALQYAHDAGIVHRDIKPENILLDRKGRVKVADFGLAKLVGSASSDGTNGTKGMDGRGEMVTTTEAGHVMGTPQYMAPEQVAHSSDVDHRADIYSLGVVFYQMLTGELPKVGFAPPSKKVVVDVRLDEIVLRALEQNPVRRYQQVSEVKTMVETITRAAPPAIPVTGNGRGADFQSLEKTLQPRFSRAAIAGVIWASLFFLTSYWWLFFESHAEGYGTAARLPGPPGWQIALIVAAAVLGLSAPFGATTLGWTAVSRIRRSAGKLCGLGLAVFDGLFFPLLALDGLIAGLCVTASKMFVAFYANADLQDRTDVNAALVTKLANFMADHPATLFFVIAPIAVIADWLIIRRVWRAVTGAGAGARADGATPSRRRRLWGAALLIAVLAIGIPLLRYNRQAPPRNAGDPITPHLMTVQATPHAAAPWSAQLPCGATVELLGVAENPSEAKAWWRPDGSPWAERPYASVGGAIEVERMRGWIAREFVVRLTHLPPGRVATTWFIRGGGHKVNGEEPVGEPPGEELRAVATDFSADRERATVWFGLASGDWIDCAQRQWRQETNRSGRREVPSDLPAGITLSDPVAVDRDSTVKVTHDREGEVRVVARDFAGRDYHGVASLKGSRRKEGPSGPQVFYSFSARFEVLSPENIALIALQYRPYQWAVYSEVALQPGLTAPTPAAVQHNPNAGAARDSSAFHFLTEHPWVAFAAVAILATFIDFLFLRRFWRAWERRTPALSPRDSDSGDDQSHSKGRKHNST